MVVDEDICNPQSRKLRSDEVRVMDRNYKFDNASPLTTQG